MSSMSKENGCVQPLTNSGYFHNPGNPNCQPTYNCCKNLTIRDHQTTVSWCCVMAKITSRSFKT